MRYLIRLKFGDKIIKGNFSKMKRSDHSKTIVAAVMVLLMTMSVACSSNQPAETTTTTSAATTASQTEETTATTTTEQTEDTTETSKIQEAVVPEGFIGYWSCEDLASDGKTDTSFYAMYIKKNGYFSIYDQAAGNPGISGFMKNDTGSSVSCVFEMDDFDVPFCWKLESPEDNLDYELDGDNLKLGHNDVWMIFHREESDEEEDIDYEHLPESLDNLISYDLPKDYLPDMKYKYNDEEWNPVVQRAYMKEDEGYVSFAIFSFEGYDCLGEIDQAIDVNDYINKLKDKKEIDIGGQTGYIGTIDSDDTEEMSGVAYVAKGDYVFEFRLDNFDDKVTDKQMKTFEDIIGTVKFK